MCKNEGDVAEIVAQMTMIDSTLPLKSVKRLVIPIRLSVSRMEDQYRLTRLSVVIQNMYDL